MTKTLIPIADLENYHLYLGEGRNFDIAVWFGDRFYGLRNKWNEWYVDRELHHAADDRYGTFSPYKDLGSLQERLSPACFNLLEWRSQVALHDMLFCAEAVLRGLGSKEEGCDKVQTGTSDKSTLDCPS